MLLSEIIEGIKENKYKSIEDILDLGSSSCSLAGNIFETVICKLPILFNCFDNFKKMTHDFIIGNVNTGRPRILKNLQEYLKNNS